MRRWILFSFVLAAAALFAACSRAPQTPTVDPAALTAAAVAQATEAQATEQRRLTVQAQLNQELSATPTPQPTATSTRTATPTVTATITPRPTATASPLPSATASSTPAPFLCRLIRQDPSDGVTMKKDQAFTTTWKVQNVGTDSWNHVLIDFLWVGMDKFGKTLRIDLPQDVRPFETVELVVPMEAPITTGSFRTDWKLVQVETGETFCPLYLKIWVSDK